MEVEKPNLILAGESGGRSIVLIEGGGKKKQNKTGKALDYRSDPDGGVVFPPLSVMESCDYGEPKVKALAQTQQRWDKVTHFQQPGLIGVVGFSHFFLHGFGPRKSDTVKLNDAKIHKFKVIQDRGTKQEEC